MYIVKSQGSKSLAQWQHELRKAQRHLTPLQLPFRQPPSPQQLRGRTASSAVGVREQGWELRMVEDLALQLPWRNTWRIIPRITNDRSINIIYESINIIKYL